MKNLTDLLEQVFLRTEEPLSISQLLDENPLGPYEIASMLWSWFYKRRQEVPFDYLQRLGVPELEKALALISEEALTLPLNRILSTETGERAIASFLDENQHLLRAATGFYSPGDSGHCLKEFKFGTDFVADFVIVNSRRSIPPLIIFVELEPVSDPVFTQKGIPSQRLQMAIMQVKQWQYWINQHRDAFITELKKRLKNALDPTSLQSWIYQNEASMRAYILIGRRKDIEGNDHRHILAVGEPNLTIHTYDTLLDITYNFDNQYFEEMKRLHEGD